MRREKKSKRIEKSIQPQSPELDAEKVPSIISDDSTHSPNGEKTMTVNFESLAQAEKSQAVADHERYQMLLRDLAAGKDREETDILEICRRVDRNVAMLEEDVAWRKRRDELIAEVRKVKQYENEQDEVDAELASIRAEFEKVEAEYDKKRWPLQAKYNRAKESLYQIWLHRNELEKDCRDQSIFDELESLNEQQNWQRIKFIEDKGKEIQREIGFAQQELDELPSFCPGRKEKAQFIKARIKDLQARYEKGQLEIAELERKDAAIKIREAELREAMIFA